MKYGNTTENISNLILSINSEALAETQSQVQTNTLDGHVGWIKGTAAVFKNLHKMKVGDKIIVQDDKGTMIHFVVREIRQYNAKDDATNIFISNDGKAHLNIITCTGAWNKKINQYSKRLVIFTDKE